MSGHGPTLKRASHRRVFRLPRVQERAYHSPLLVGQIAWIRLVSAHEQPTRTRIGQTPDPRKRHDIERGRTAETAHTPSQDGRDRAARPRTPPTWPASYPPDQANPTPTTTDNPDSTSRLPPL